MNITSQPSRGDRQPGAPSRIRRRISSAGLKVLAIFALVCPLTAPAIDAPSCPPAPTCDTLPFAPASLLAKVSPGDHFLFYGDSITKRNQDTPFHYGDLTRHLLARTYRQFCETPITFVLDGEEGRKPYSKGRNLHLAGQIPKGVPAYDWVMVQDSGAPTAPVDFTEDVEKSITAALASSETAKIFLATTPPLDESETVAGNCRRYVRACNWTSSNDIVRQFVEDTASPRLFSMPLDLDTCPVYRLNGTRVTGDGVHLTSLGSITYALAIFDWLGGNLSDIPDCAFTQDDGTTFDAELNKNSGVVVRETMSAAGEAECRMDTSCQFNPLSEAAECISYCLEGDNDCRPYFNVVAACCVQGSCIDYVDAGVCDSAFSGVAFADGTTCTPGCCDNLTCNVQGTTTTTSLPGPEEGACCDGLTCSEPLTEQACQAAAGTWHGAETTCTADCCSAGNCIATTTTTSSSSTTTSSQPPTTTLPPCGIAAWETVGTTSTEHLGAALESVGDLNDDGAPELAAGVPTSDETHAGGGGVVILDGLTGTILSRIPGASRNARTGTALAALGDGESLIVGSPGAGSAALEGVGQVAIWNLSAPTAPSLTATLVGTNNRSHLGSSLASFGDGQRFLAGSPDASDGRGRVDFFQLAGDAISTVLSFEGSQIGSRFGAALSAFRDNNRFVIGSPGHDNGSLPNTGSADVHTVTNGSDSPALISVEGSSAGDALGSAVSARGSFWIVGSPGSSSGTGHLGIYHLGAEDPAIPVLTVLSPTPSALFGSSLCILDAEPLTFAAGAPRKDSDAAARAGGAVIFRQNVDTVEELMLIEGVGFGDGLGSALAALNTDGLAVAAPGADGSRDGTKSVRGGGAVFAHSLCDAP